MVCQQQTWLNSWLKVTCACWVCHQEKKKPFPALCYRWGTRFTVLFQRECDTEVWIAHAREHVWDYGGMMMSLTHKFLVFYKPHGLNTNLSLLHGLTHDVTQVSFFKDYVSLVWGKLRGSFAPFKAAWDGWRVSSKCPCSVQDFTPQQEQLWKCRILAVPLWLFLSPKVPESFMER